MPTTDNPAVAENSNENSFSPATDNLSLSISNKRQLSEASLLASITETKKAKTEEMDQSGVIAFSAMGIGDSTEVSPYRWAGDPNKPPANGVCVMLEKLKDEPDILNQIIEDSIAKIIIEDKLPKIDTTVKPFYQCGALIHGLYSLVSRNDESDINSKPNIDLRLLSTNKLFHQTGAKIFYSTHVFILKDPVIAKWWFKRIGDRNLKQIRHLILTLNTGYPGRQNTNAVMCAERVWFNALCVLLQANEINRVFQPTGLTNFTIIIDTWSPLNPRTCGLTAHQYGEIKAFRIRVLEKLGEFRQVKEVVFVNEGYDYLPAHIMERLVREMKMEGDQGRVAARKSLADIFEMCGHPAPVPRG